MSKLAKAGRALTIILPIVDGISWAIDKIRARRKRRFTDAEREQATREAKERLDEIVRRAKR